MEKQRLYTVFPFLSELTEKQKKQFEDYFETAPNWVLDDCQVAELGKNDVLLRENTAVDTVYFVGKGAFKGIDFRVYGVEYDFMFINGVYALGAMEIILGLSFYQTTLVAVVPSVVVKIPRVTFEKWLTNDAKILRHEVKAFGNSLLEEVRNARLNLFLNGSDRLAMIFAKMYESEEKNGILKIPYTRQELSEISGLCVKTVNRAVKKFWDGGQIGRSGSKITINKEQYQSFKEMLKDILGDI